MIKPLKTRLVPDFQWEDSISFFKFQFAAITQRKLFSSTTGDFETIQRRKPEL